MRPFTILALALAAGCAPPPPPSGVLITLDTTNARALGCYGRALGHTPNLDALAAQGLVFERARAVAPLTLPSHASMLTGLYPLRHGVRDNGFVPLPPSAETLAERARAAGYRTAAFVAAAVLDAPYGLDQGFEVYEGPGGGGSPEAERRASAVADSAARWIAAHGSDGPFFLWVHFFDPHAPYEPAPEHLARADGRAYLGEVAAADEGVGRVLAALREAGLYDRTLVVVAGDHGEAFGRHGEPTHSVLCYDATLHVPLFVRAPGGARAGERSEATVSVADVFPTFLDGLSLGAPGDVDGASLLRPVAADRGVYFESYCGYLNYGWSPLAGWVDAGSKYLHSSRPELYDVGTDPREERDLLGERPELARRHREEIARLASRPALDPADGADLDPEYRARVQALGYAGTADPTAQIPHPLAPSELESPAQRVADLKAFYDAAVELEQGRRGAALERMRALAAANPQNAYARAFLGKNLVADLRFEEALEPLRELVALGWERAETLLLLGTCYERTGELEPALDAYRRAHRLTPRSHRSLEAVVRVLRRLGREEEARSLEGLEAAGDG